MSKELAQTVGGKRTAWLVAILAALAVFATVATQWRGADATVTAGSYTLEGPFAAAPADLAACQAGTGVIAAPVAYNSTVWYCVGAAADATIVSPAVISIDLPSSVTPTGAYQDTAPDANCTSNNVAGGDYTCTLNGLTGTSTYYVAVAATAQADHAAGAPNATVDDPSAQTPQSATDSTSALDVQVSTISIVKAISSGSITSGGNITFTITVTCNDGADDISCAGINITDTLDADFASIQSVATTQGSCSGVGPFPDASDPWNLSCSIGTLAELATATITVTATVPVYDGSSTLTFTNQASGTQTTGPSATSNTLNMGSLTPTLPDLDPGLWHVTADGSDLADYRDDPNNLIGFVHRVCYVQDSDDDISYPLNGIIPPSTANGDASDYYWRIATISGTATVTGQSQVELSFSQYANGIDLACVQWYSTGAGEQEVTIVNGDGEVVANWGGSDDPSNNGDPVDSYEPLVKEWNTLVPTIISGVDGKPGADGIGNALTGTNYDGQTVNVPAIFNPATSEFEGERGFFENVLGSHQSIGGPVPPAGKMLWVDGALVTFTITGSCGAAWIEGNDTLEGVDERIHANQSDDEVTVTSIGVPIEFTIDSDNCSSADSSTTTVTISVDYPTNIGSISPEPPADEKVTVRWTTVRPVKDVFLAWAGQRIVLEHDWRLGPGDDPTSTRNTYDPAGVCPFEGRSVSLQADAQQGEFRVDYVRGSGPGNFVAGLGATQWPSGWRDGASVWVSTDNDQTKDAAGDPQGACISRVIYESEDQGQVDIEAFVDLCGDLNQCTDNQTKIAFVVYYMKIEKVMTSLVTGNEDNAPLVKKPKHNATGADFAPGNPYRYDNDLTDATQNVSTDVLVRVRVKGWFTTSNPSGREADATDPNNVLPANRWVMPDDWARLIAGGAGIDFRPEYDYMFAPNSSIRLTNPTGTADVLVTTVAERSANTTSSLKVASLNQLAVGVTVKVGSTTATARTITAINTDTSVITLSGACCSSTPAAGANVYLVSGVPFEGPFSLIDIQDGPSGQGLYGQGFGSAALSNLVVGAVRDTRNGDKVLDWYDAPMPSAPVTVDIRKAGFIKQVLKQDVYYLGTADSTSQTYPNPYYYSNVPESPYLPSSVAGGSFLWDSWALDGPQGNGQGAYNFWTPIRIGVNINGNAGETLTTAQQTELSEIRTVYDDPTIARRLVVFSDNHGEAMVAANGDFNLTYDECDNNLLGGGKHCASGDLVGSSDVFATADYPDFRGKHFPVRSNTATIKWTWGGFKNVTIEPGEVEQYVYVVFRALDRDGFCQQPSSGTVSLHPVLTSWDDDFTFSKAGSDPVEAVDFLIDSDEGGIIIQTSSGTSPIEVTREGTKQGGIGTYSTKDTTRSETATNELRKFAPLNSGAEECQAWVKLSNSLLGVTNVLVFAHDDEGLIGFDKIVDFNDTVEYTLNFRWSLITWLGADNISPANALDAKGDNTGGTSILNQVTAVYGWEASSQKWLAFFPDGVSIPGANDLTGLREGSAYWIAIKGPSSITWKVVTNVD